ncbi:MAG: helix-turn-helix transcriptional regulator [Pseudorhodobacter sp.]|nr:helix-turn-helix transcriptional regulator [Pseudorhodobacter sp.]
MPDKFARLLRAWSPRSWPAGVWPLALLIAFQTLCVVVFLRDVVSDLALQSWADMFDVTNLSEIAAMLGLGIGLVFEAFVLLRLLKRQARMQQSLTAAATALSDLMQTYFETWGLTPTEQDVAAFTIKGCSIAEIATLRGSAEGTIKTHLNAIYRKSGVSGRAQLISVLVDDLLQTPLIAPGLPQRRRAG